MQNYNLYPAVIEDDHTWYADKVVRILKTKSGDWVGIYVDGKLVDEGHSLDVMQVLVKVLGNGADVREAHIKDHYLDDYGSRCPIEWPNELEVVLQKQK